MKEVIGVCIWEAKPEDFLEYPHETDLLKQKLALEKFLDLPLYASKAVISADFELREINSKLLNGPNSLTCDRVGATINTCKTCFGTGDCRYGKTEEEFNKLKNNS